MWDQLKLPTITKDPLVIKIFGNEEIDGTETRDKVQFTVGDIGRHSKTRMEAPRNRSSETLVLSIYFSFFNIYKKKLIKKPISIV